MSIMMIFFCVMFFKVPAGLCIYFITSSLWGLGERLFLKKDSPKQATEEKKSLAAHEAKLTQAKAEKGERRKELARKQQKKR
jgi:YidC/Oxa1 family membrane protein insertase